MKADWLTPGEAVRRVIIGVRALEPEEEEVSRAAGRALAEDVVTPIDLPLWTNSAMDGFAVRAGDVVGASPERPVVLPISDDIPAGGFPSGPLRPGSAARIMTGAPVPDGADSVIRVEHTAGGSGRGETVSILSDQDAERNLRHRGEEVERGEVVLAAGEVLNAAGIGVAVTVGRRSLQVVRRPRVALLTSGDELVDLDDFDQVLAGRKIVSSNSYTLAAQLTSAGAIVHSLGIARDTPESLRAALQGAQGCDALVTSAGISVGEHDHVKQVLLDLGASVQFWRVRMRPGSPFAFGHIAGLGGMPWFGLPGNPVSSATTFELFVRPALFRMAGRQAIFPRALVARLAEDYVMPPGLTHFPRVRLMQGENGDVIAHLTGPQGSGMLSSFARADGLMVIPEERSGGRTGERYPVIPLEGGAMVESPAF